MEKVKEKLSQEWVKRCYGNEILFSKTTRENAENTTRYHTRWTNKEYDLDIYPGAEI